MKEAAGEANMTVITIVLIAIVLTIGIIIVNSMMENIKNRTACTSCGGSWNNGQCLGSNNTIVEYTNCLD